MWLLVVTTIMAVVLGLRFTYRYRTRYCTSTRKLHGKTAIVTGASAGLGKETALDLAHRGARVIMACRNLVKAQPVAVEIRTKTGNRNVEVRHLDLSSLASVRKFGQDILDSETAIHILVNNAGIFGSPERKLTDDGLEITMETNHLGHFLLTNLLLGKLKASTPSRVINVSSDTHNCRTFDPDDLNYEKQPYPGPFGSYKSSKLANILFTLELSEKLRGTGVTTNSLHPGAVSTEIVGKNPTYWWLTPIMDYLMWTFALDVKRGAQTQIYLAVSEEVDGVTGKYFDNCQVTEPFTKLAQDPDLAKRLWDASERLVNLVPEEKHY